MCAEFGGRTTIIPTMRYRDAHAAIDWLCRTLGFERHLVVPGAGGGVDHAQLTLGGGMIMLGSARDTDYDATVVPATPGGQLTQSPYIVVDDIAASYARAQAAGAEVVMALAEQPHGGSLYSVRDPEGQLWNVGDYDPWAQPGATAGG